MIDYELAKQLKDAGFPFIKCTIAECWYSGDSLDTGDGNYHYPTLSELIEACGDEFRTFYRITDNNRHLFTLGRLPEDARWCAESITNEWFSGSTPEEAVARLWLALNKNQ